jgi:hypothetical protein
MPTALDNGQRSARKLLRAVIARLLGRKPSLEGWNQAFGCRKLVRNRARTRIRSKRAELERLAS